MIAFHIGFPKSASTFIKRRYLSGSALSTVIPRGGMLRDIRTLEGVALLDSLQASGVNLNENTVFSNEMLVGDSFWSVTGSERVPRNIASAFPEAKILMVLREQVSYIHSAYRFSVMNGSVLPALDRFMEDIAEDIERKLSYHMLVEEYLRHFPSEQVLVLPFEMLKMNPARFENTVERFLELPEGQARNALPERRNSTAEIDWKAVMTLRKCNRVLRYTYALESRLKKPRHNSLRKLGEHPNAHRALVRLIARIHVGSRAASEYPATSEVGLLFAKSNARTSDLIGLNLEEYGYTVPE